MSDDRNSSGLATAVASLGGFGDVGIDAQQDDLFEPDTPLPMKAAPRSVSSRGGRPVGAGNKSTEAWRAYILGRYRSPLIALCEIYSRSPRELAEELGLYEYAEITNIDGRKTYEKRLATGEAFKRQVEAMVAALPYLHQKLPLAIEQKGDKRGLLMIGDINVAISTTDGLPLAPEEPPMIDVTPEKPEVAGT